MTCIRTIAFCFTVFLIILHAGADTSGEPAKRTGQLASGETPKKFRRPKKKSETQELKKQLAELRTALTKLGAAPETKPAGEQLTESLTEIPQGLKQLRSSLNEYEVEAAELYTRIHLLTTKLILSASAKQEARDSTAAKTPGEAAHESKQQQQAFNPAPLFPHPARAESTVEDFETVDRIKLADMLFRNGDYKSALENYRSATELELEQSDRDWINFQIASCLRNLGKLSEAAALYRELMATTQSRELARAAGWFLDVIRWRSEMNQALQDLENRRNHVAEAIANGNISE